MRQPRVQIAHLEKHVGPRTRARGSHHPCSWKSASAPLEGFRSKLGRAFNAVVMLDTEELETEIRLPRQGG
ncbi:MAG: hypothetical protein WDN28_21790 [Chthoniobacter sp.]